MKIIPLTSNMENGKLFYELQINGQKAFIEYHIFNNNLVLLMSSGVTRDLLNPKQVHEALIERVLDQLRRVNLKIITYCPIINEYISKNKQYKNMLVSNHIFSEVS